MVSVLGTQELGSFWERVVQPHVFWFIGTRYGGSSGTNFAACLRLAADMRARGERGSLVTLLCDRGKRYQQTLFDPGWRDAHGLDIAPWQRALGDALANGTLAPPTASP